MKYDVFISYSRQDYVDEHEVVKADSPVKAILEFLDAHQISCWFDKEGIYSGSEFVEVIANAIADSKMMLFVSSEHSNESIYTAGEIFEAIENNQLIIPIKIDGSKYNKKFKLLLNPLDYIDFSKNDALTDLLKAVENEKARIAKIEADEALRREELKKREWRKSVKHEIQEQANELQKLKDTRNALLESIYKKLRSIDITKKQCPVCESKVDIETDYCQACGWFFPSLSEIDGVDMEVDKSVLILAKSRWENKETISCLETKNKELETQIGSQKVKINSLTQKLESCKKENETLRGQTKSDSSLRSNIIKILIGCILGFILCVLFFIIVAILLPDKEKHSTDVNSADSITLSETMASSGGGVSNDEFVDLGLSVMWARCNLGASSPQESGGYYAWGEVDEKVEYSEETYSFQSGSSDISNTRYDVVTKTLGEDYRMPTREEMEELIFECEWKEFELDGLDGMIVTGKNGNSIFIPNVGSKEESPEINYNMYWTSTRSKDGDAYALYMGYNKKVVLSTKPYSGFPIRPVKIKDGGREI